MLAIIAGAGFRMLLPLLRRFRLLFAMVAGLLVGNVVVTLAKLHPLEYVAMNTLAGGTRGAYDRFELDYLAVAATEALRRLESRLEYERPAEACNDKPPSILICIPWREWAVAPMLTRPWTIETDADKADFVIETERWRCAADRGLHLIDEVKRFDRSFAWTYARRGADVTNAKFVRRLRTRPHSAIQSAGKQVEQDNDGVAGLLPFGDRISAVMDSNWPLDVVQSARADLGQEFGRMRHSILPQPDRAGAAAGHGPQPIVCVGQSKPRRDAGEHGGRLEQQPTQRGNIG